VPRPPKETVLSKNQLGERVRALREQRGLSQGQLAELVSTHPQSLSQVERGIRSLTLQQVVKLSRALKVSTDEILGEPGRSSDGVIGDRKLLRRVRRIQELPPAQREAVLDMLDGALRMSRTDRAQ
jgi:transcriptional regulator with XRE-family HTH domain